MRAPMAASFSAAIAPIPEVAPVITTIFPCMEFLPGATTRLCEKYRARAPAGPGWRPLAPLPGHYKAMCFAPQPAPQHRPPCRVDGGKSSAFMHVYTAAERYIQLQGRYPNARQGG